MQLGNIYCFICANRCPENITNADIWTTAGIANAEPTITCAEAVSRQMAGQQLKYPGLFCVGIMYRPSLGAARRNSPDLSKRYNTWPLECCV
jgi:hypothetical protein